MKSRAEQDSRKISRRDLLSFGLKGTALLGLARVGIACGGNDTSPSDTDTPEKTLSESPTPAGTFSQTPESTRTSTPKDTLSPVNCEIFETQYCAGGKLADWTDESTGTTIKVAVFNLPEGTPILSPFDGQFSGTNGEGNPINPNAPMIEVYDSDSPKKTDFILTGDITIREDLDLEHAKVKKGDILAYVKETGIKVLDGNIALTLDSFDLEKGTRGTDETMLTELFPSLFEK